MAKSNPYEEQRRRQVEENKRKLDELLSAAVRDAAVKPMLTKELKLRCLRPAPAPARRSGRVATLPKQPDYRDTMNKTRRRGLPPAPVYATDEARAYTFTKAKELKNQLCSDQPSFIRPVSNYYATKSALRIPLQFSERYLPRCDETISLMDQEDVEFQVLYLAEGSAIGSGWNLFAIEHKLADGDCLVFQLVHRTKFKVKQRTMECHIILKKPFSDPLKVQQQLAPCSSSHILPEPDRMTC